MEKKKLKLSISGNTKKTISNIERAKYQPKNSIIIEKKNVGFSKKRTFTKSINKVDNLKIKNNFTPSKAPGFTTDYEKRKLAEQRATKRVKGEEINKDNKFPKKIIYDYCLKLKNEKK